MKGAVIYARVSTIDRGQDPDTQLRQPQAKRGDTSGRPVARSH
jgi:predicted site-specific integrase-resolvase